MCYFASAMITKEGVYFGDTDRHSKIIDQHGLNEWGVLGPNVVKLELIPDKLSDPIAKWRFFVDQDELPNWFDASASETRMRNAVRRSGIRKAYAEYNKATAAAQAKCNKVHAAALAEYRKVHAAARAKCDKATTPAWAEFKKVRDTARNEYDKVCAPARAEYDKVRDAARNEYVAKRKRISEKVW